MDQCGVRSAECGFLKTFLASLACLAWLSASQVGAEIKFEDVKGGKSDPLGRNESLSFRVLFNNISMSGSKVYGGMVGLAPSIGAFYTRDGRELAFSVYGDFGVGTGWDKTTSPRTAITESRSFLLDWGLDLNYIMMNGGSFFWSAGLAEHSHWGGVIVEQTNTRFSAVPVINLLGINTRARFYPLQEFFVTGYLGMSFISIYSRELQGYAVGTPAADPGQASADADSPFAFVFEFSGEYRPTAGFTFHGGLRYRNITYKAADPSNGGVVTGKGISFFSPFFGVTLLY